MTFLNRNVSLGSDFQNDHNLMVSRKVSFHEPPVTQEVEINNGSLVNLQPQNVDNGENRILVKK